MAVRLGGPRSPSVCMPASMKNARAAEQVPWQDSGVIRRTPHLRRLAALFRTFRVVGILGARQVGKTTLAGQFGRSRRGPVHRFDLEDPRDMARLEDPMLALEGLRGLVVLDEIQRRPELLPVLRVLVDRPRGGAKFLVLGNASPELLRQTSESLAGRIYYHRLRGFGIEEVGVRNEARLWLRGGFPPSYSARGDASSMDWRLQYIETFLRRDLPQLGVSIQTETLRRFWTMLAHYHGQVWNTAEFARSLGVNRPTVERYLDALVATFAVRRLRPWRANLNKRQVKSPKVYVEDTGLLHALLNLPHRRDLEGHPKAGASWEGLAMGEVVARLGARWDECWFWGTHQGAELDLLVVRGKRRLGFEFKRTSAPCVSRSMRIALEDLGLGRLTIVHAGSDSFPLARNVSAVALADVRTEIRPL